MLGSGNVLRVGNGFAAPREDLVHDGLGRIARGPAPVRFASQVIDGDTGASPGKGQRIGPSDPASRAGDSHDTFMTDR
jgi:hypothetical protein